MNKQLLCLWVAKVSLWILVVFVLFAAVVASGAELKLPDSPVKPFTLIRLEIVGVEGVEDIMVMTAKDSTVSFVDLESSASANTFVFTGPPGTYSIRVKCKNLPSALVGRVEVGPVVPFPVPSPSVPPPSIPVSPSVPAPVPNVPAPTIPKRSLGLLILDELDSLTPERNSLFQQFQTNPELKDYLSTNQHRLWIMDDDQPQIQSWVNRTTVRPGIVVFTPAESASSVLEAGNCPGSVADLLALVKKHEVESTVSQVTYVFEKDDTAVPAPVLSGLAKLNDKGILATYFEEDTVDGDNQVPQQYVVALSAARSSGLPSLVAQAGSSVIRVVKSPTTEQQVLELAP